MLTVDDIKMGAAFAGQRRQGVEERDFLPSRIFGIRQRKELISSRYSLSLIILLLSIYPKKPSSYLSPLTSLAEEKFL